ncbi:unnamed protein product [Rhizoctonia solani]|uniref:NWD2 C-terminal beta-propeller domain-containing protein n=1 Tax=Rhizoctonia solani TaxID=456999 RepID=A0A8H2XCL1_9AGAM|nr:unnamed protein product [Rhizoctonia solani]
MLSRDRSAGFYCAAPEHHIFMTQACLKRIRENPVQFNLCGIESSYLLDHEIQDLNERANRAISPSLMYACCHWVSHLELAGQSVDLQRPVADFLLARLLLWMEVLSIKKCLDQGDDVLQRVGKWCHAAQMHNDIVFCAYDSSLFLSRCRFFGISQSTPHIYTSLLRLWPSSNPVAKYYIPRTNGLLQQGTAITRRYLPQLAHRHMGEPVNAVCYYPNMAFIAAAAGNAIYILDGHTLQIASGPWEGHTDTVISIAISPDCSYIASGSYDATIRVWDSQSGTPVTDPINAHPDRVTSVAFSPDGARLVSTGGFDAIRVWSVKSGKQLASTVDISERPECIRKAVFSADGSRIVSGDENQVVCYWNAGTGRLISRQNLQHIAPVNLFALSSDGSRLVSASENSMGHIWDTEAQQVMQDQLNGNYGNIKQVTFSPDNMYVASCGNALAISVWDASTGKLIATIGVIDSSWGIVNLVAFSPDRSHLVSCTDQGLIQLWDVRFATRFNAIQRGRQPGIHSACFSSDGSHIVTGRRDGSIWLWNTSTGDLVTGPLTGHLGYICSVAISPDGAYIASASSDKTIRLWDVKAEGGRFTVLDHHITRPHSLIFSPEGAQLLYGSVIYSIGTSPFTSEVAPNPNYANTEDEWPEHPSHNKISCTVSSPDGMYVASSDEGGFVKLQHTQTGQTLLGPLQGHTGAISQVLFSPDGMHMVTCSLDDTIRFWPIPGKSSHKSQGYASTASGKGVNMPPTACTWKLSDAGSGGKWIMNDKGEHLVCMPVDLCPSLLLPENNQLICYRGWLTINLTTANIGEQWKKCYEPVPPNQYCTL